MTGPGIYGWSTGSGGVHFHHIVEPLRVAATHGVRTGHGHVLNDDVCADHDTIITHMLWDERPSEAWEKLAAGGRHRLVFVIDDVMWAPDWAPFARHYTPEVLRRVWRNIELSHVVITPSEVIAEQVRRYNRNVHVIPNTVPAYLLDVVAPPRPAPAGPAGRCTHIVGYQGSPSHEHDFHPQLLRELMTFVTRESGWGLHFWGPGTLPGWSPDVAGCTPWQPHMRSYYQSLSMDIGIGPLRPSLFNAGKSSLRAVEYAALGVPCLLSDGPAYRGTVEQGVTGYLIGPGESWLPYLRELARDPIARAAMGAAARRRAAGWTTEANIGRWMGAINSV